MKAFAQFAKWIGAGLGTALAGPMGGILGFILGSALEGFSQADIEGFQRYLHYSHPEAARFEISLLILSAHVIKSDGQASPEELNYVRQYFISAYGPERARQLFKLFKNIAKQDNASVRQVCLQVKAQLSHPMRLQLLHYLFGIARADGQLCAPERALLQRIISYLNISDSEFQGILRRYGADTASAYSVLGLTEEADEQTLKSTYRKMVKKYHPDKVSTLGEPYISRAKERFQEIQQAYEQIKRERGF